MIICSLYIKGNKLFGNSLAVRGISRQSFFGSWFAFSFLIAQTRTKHVCCGNNMPSLPKTVASGADQTWRRPSVSVEQTKPRVWFWFWRDAACLTRHDASLSLSDEFTALSNKIPSTKKTWMFLPYVRYLTESHYKYVHLKT